MEPSCEGTTLKETLRGLKGILMRLRSLLIAGVLVSASLAARADNYSTFDLNSSYILGGTIDGTLTLDTTTNMFTGADLTVAGFLPYQDGTLDQVGLQSPTLFGYGVNVFSTGSPFADVNLFLATITLAGYDGSPVVFPTNVTFLSFPSLYFAGSGTLEPASVTPEPNSLLLLATGLLGFAGLAWRKAVA
jgi:PEP-CTERM motif